MLAALAGAAVAAYQSGACWGMVEAASRSRQTDQGGDVASGATGSTPPGAYGPGAVWQVESWILSRGDRKPGRPVVIVQAERHGLGFVVVWARTSDVGARGVLTPRLVLPGMSKDGVIAPRFQHQIELSRLRPPFASFLGVLPEPYRSQVSAAWEEGL